MTIQILGTGCPKCKALEAAAREAVAKAGIEAEVVKISDLEEIIKEYKKHINVGKILINYIPEILCELICDYMVDDCEWKVSNDNQYFDLPNGPYEEPPYHI